MEERKTIRNFIITLTGPSGCGKSFVMKRIMELKNKFCQEGLFFEPESFPKYVTRPMRLEEIKAMIEHKPIDIKSVDYIPKDCDLKYQTYGKQYAIRLQDIRDVLNRGACPVVVINDVRVVEELKKVFPNQVLALFLFREIPKRESFDAEAGKRGGKGAKEEAEKRYNKAIAIYRTYIENIGLFNRVILNVGNINTPDYAQIQLETLIRSILVGKLRLESKRNGTPKLFIIAGHAQSGKDEIIKAIDDMGKLQATIIRKYTSRRQDEDDGDEMICRLVPSKTIMQVHIDAYNRELDLLKQEFEKRKGAAGDDISKLTKEYDWFFDSTRNIVKPKDRFWNQLKQEEDKIADAIKLKILDEASDSHKLEKRGLYNMSIEELRDLYCQKGYHDDSVDAESISKEWNEQQIINALMEEASVENDVTPEKLSKMKKYKDVVSLYKKDGYHFADSDLSFPEREKDKVEKAMFVENRDYIDLFALYSRHEKAKSKKEQPQRWAPDDKACYLTDNDIGYILYENNKTRYGFEVYNVPTKDKLLLSKIKNEKKHLVLVASLPEIFKWCEKYTNGNVITVFAHSEISAAEFEKIATSDAAIRKLGSYPKEILKYSNNIDKFDHVTIFAEDHVKEEDRATKEEELFDQMFRLFRFYNGS